MKERSVQPQHDVPALLRFAAGATSRIAPGLATRWAGQLFRRPRRRPVRPAERAVLERAHRLDLPSRGHRIAVYTWGDGPTVLLLHGWSANAAQMTRFVDPLLERGFSVAAIDAVAHGSSGGRSSSLVDMSADAVTVVDRLGGVPAVIGHSMGAMAAARLLRQRPVDRVVILSPPAEMEVYSRLFAEVTGFPPSVHDAMVARFERTHGIRWRDVCAERMVPDRPVACRVVFDEDDRDAPADHARRWIDAWPGRVDVLRTTGLGHRQILRDARVVESCADWLASGGDEGAPAARSGAQGASVPD